MHHLHTTACRCGSMTLPCTQQQVNSSTAPLTQQLHSGSVGTWLMPVESTRSNSSAGSFLVKSTPVLVVLTAYLNRSLMQQHAQSISTLTASRAHSIRHTQPSWLGSKQPDVSKGQNKTNVSKAQKQCDYEHKRNNSVNSVKVKSAPNGRLNVKDCGTGDSDAACGVGHQ